MVPTRLLVVAALAALLAACGGPSVDATAMTEVRLGVLPDDAPEVLIERYAPVAQFLEERLGTTVTIVVPSSYEDLVERFADQRTVDVAVFGGLTYVLASARTDADPLVMRDIDARFVTAFISRPGAGDALVDFEGHTIAFGSRLSTSGHLMPRHFLRQLTSSAPEDYFADVAFAGSHDAAVFAVLDGTADLAAVNHQILDEMVADGRVDTTDIEVVWVTPPYVDYVWAAGPDVGDAVKETIVSSLVELSTYTESGAAVLAPLGAQGFLPAVDRDFEAIRTTAGRLGLLGTVDE